MARPRRNPLDFSVEPEPKPSLSVVTPDPASVDPGRTPARQKLADAIATVKALEAEIADAGAALSEAETRKWETASALREAEEELERAKPRPANSHFRPREPHTFRSQEEADAYTAMLSTPPPLIEDAKAAVANAVDARDSALSAYQFQDRRLRQATDRLAWNRSIINDAARVAVHFDPAMAALAAETKSLVTRAAAAVRAFEDATGGVLLQPNHAFYRSTEPTDFRTDPEGWALLHRWREALAALHADPDAPLPMPE